jgi:hypothetical protein
MLLLHLLLSLFPPTDAAIDVVDVAAAGATTPDDADLFFTLAQPLLLMLLLPLSLLL